MNRPGRIRISMDLPKEIYNRMKQITKKHNITMTKMVLRAIIKQLLIEDRYE